MLRRGRADECTKQRKQTDSKSEIPQCEESCTKSDCTKEKGMFSHGNNKSVASFAFAFVGLSNSSTFDFIILSYTTKAVPTARSLRTSHPPPQSSCPDARPPGPPWPPRSPPPPPALGRPPPRASARRPAARPKSGGRRATRGRRPGRARRRDCRPGGGNFCVCVL